MMRALLLAVITLATTAAVGLATASDAQACSLGSHCHAIANWDPSGTFDGGLSQLTTSRLTNNGSSDDFVTSELWVIDSFGNFKWVEEGAIAGRNGSRRWFWAESCSLFDFDFHSTTLSFTLGTLYAAKISYSGNGYWGVYRDGSQLTGGRNCHGSTADGMQTGSESTHNAQVVSGTAINLQKRASSSGSWSYNWGGSTFGPPDSPMTGGWLTQYQALWYSEN
jgi:hypothetical protein